MVQFLITQMGTQYELKGIYSIYQKAKPEKDGSTGIYLFRSSNPDNDGKPDDGEILLAKYKSSSRSLNVHDQFIELLNSTELDKLTVKLPADYKNAVDKWLKNAKEYIFDRKLMVIT